MAAAPSFYQATDLQLKPGLYIAAALQNAGYAGINTIPADHTLLQVLPLRI